MKKIVLVGPPNSGKTTLFNWLTGFQNKTINYGGSTVHVSEGILQKKYQLEGKVIDTPGVYSFCPNTEDEELTCKFLRSLQEDSVIVYVLDITKMEIGLPFLFQLKEAGLPIVVALSMTDMFKTHFDKQVFEKELNLPLVCMEGLLGSGVQELVARIQDVSQNNRSIFKDLPAWSEKKGQQALAKARSIVEACQQGRKSNLFLSKKFDQVFLHPKYGLACFSLIMFTLFSSLFWLAEPFMSFVDAAFGFLINKMLSFYPESLFVDFLADGVLTSFAGVLVFVPQIFILFIGISLLEDTGYLARAVAISDGFFSRFGLSGKSFIPFLSGYACAIPACLLVRNLPSKKERWLAYFSIPFMSCSARLPVYTLLLSFLFYGESSWKLGLVLTVIYMLALFLGLGASSILNRLLKSTTKPSSFVVDLPVYRRPMFLKIFKQSYQQTKHYVVKAGPAIFTLALVIWFATSFPRDMSLTQAEQIQQSYAGYIGRFIEPVFELIGVDWRVGVGLIAAFAAREVFVSALALMFSVASTNQAFTGSLIEHMNKASNFEGMPIFTTPSILALIVFFMLALQCLSTTAVIYKESGSLKLAASQLVILNVLAYTFAVITYQGLSLFL